MKTFNVANYYAELKASLEDRISQSEIMLRCSCPRKHFYRYVLRLDKRGAIDPNLIYGTVMHFWLEWLYKGGHQGTTEKELGHASELPRMEFPKEIMLRPEVKGEIDLAVQKAWIVFKAYRYHYKNVDSYIHVLSNEKEYEVEFRGHKLVGKIDMVARPKQRDGIFIYDFKTTGRLDRSVLEAWSFRFQFLYYAWLYWKATGQEPSGTMVNGIVKPQLRPKMTNRTSKTYETRGEFLERYRLEMQMEREKYFYRQRMPLQKGRLEWFEKEMLIPNLIPFERMQSYHPKLAIGLIDLQADGMAMNTNQCHMYNSICEYLPLCKDGPMMLGEYSQRPNKHQELMEERETADV